MLSSLRLKQTICGEIIKGVILHRAGQDVINNSEYSSKISEYQKDQLWEETEEYVAIKVDRRKVMERIPEDGVQHNPENPWKEIAALQLLGNEHPNVIGLLGAYSTQMCLYEVMPYCSNGNLRQLMHSHPSGLSEHQAQEMFRQILGGLYHIHSRGVCHHDISTDNIMLNEDGKCVIIDFGMCLRAPFSYPDDPAGSEDVTDITMGTTRRLIHSQNRCGKLRFIAPEVYKRSNGFDGYGADVWSLGVVLFVLMTGRQPYERPCDSDGGYHDLTDAEYYWNNEIDQSLTWGREMSPEVVDLLRGMLQPKPRDRVTLGYILRHKWVKSTVANSKVLDQHVIV